MSWHQLYKSMLCYVMNRIDIYGHSAPVDTDRHGPPLAGLHCIDIVLLVIHSCVDIFGHVWVRGLTSRILPLLLDGRSAADLAGGSNTHFVIRTSIFVIDIKARS